MRMPLQWYAFHGDISQYGLKLIVKKWQVCPGMGGRSPPERVAGLFRNQWQVATGALNPARGQGVCINVA